MSVLIGILVLILLIWALQAYTQIDPRKLAPAVKVVGGVGALGGAVFLAARGQIGIALPLGFVDVKVCAVTEVWSGLRLVVRKELR